ncbi:MAG: NADH-quinone oxidoreductase subunit N [Candidatus Manganitrophaceae bacterium]|nr:MAG: NADH-quinone oxidoreductase subunit N [Candidatus Manganitrophaceae bacterium]
MQRADFTALLPFILLAAAAVVAMLAIAVTRSHRLTLSLTLIGLAAAFGSLFLVLPIAPSPVTPLLLIDQYALFYIGLFVAAGFAVALLAYGYLEKQEGRREEFYLLLLIATLGAAVLAASSHFASFFLGLETLSIPLFALNAYVQHRRRPLEAGIKYLVLATSSSAFLLFGMALIYTDLGTMSFRRIGALLSGNPEIHPALLLPGAAMILTGVGFKLSLVPFHFWTPDVYEGAPAPVAAFIATVSKGAVFALLLRAAAGVPDAGPMIPAISVIAAASMILGNFLALLQDNVKRMLAYSSIAQMGYILVAFLSAGSGAVETASFYLAVYFVTTLGAFGVVTLLSRPERDADLLNDYRGLFRRRPLLAGIFTAMLLSLAGLPLTAGFVGKFYIVAAGGASARWTLVLILVVTSGISLFYYLRVVVALYARTEPTEAPIPSLSLLGIGLVIVLAGLLIGLGIYPTPLIRVVQAVAAGFGSG